MTIFFNRCMDHNCSHLHSRTPQSLHKPCCSCIHCHSCSCHHIHSCQETSCLSDKCNVLGRRDWRNENLVKCSCVDYPVMRRLRPLYRSIGFRISDVHHTRVKILAFHRSIIPRLATFFSSETPISFFHYIQLNLDKYG